MEIWAAIDILRRKTVSLVQGNPSLVTDWNISPERAFSLLQEEGVDGIHIVDLDRALGIGSNEKIIRSMLKRRKIKVQVAGGIRSVDEATRILSSGASSVVLSTALLSDEYFARELLSKLKAERVAVSIDFRKDNVFTHGWLKDSRFTLYDAISFVERLGFETVIVTSIERDGTASGPDFNTYKILRAKTNLRIFGSGGIRSNQDIIKLKELGLDGAIVGRALYEGKVNIKEIK